MSTNGPEQNRTTYHLEFSDLRKFLEGCRTSKNRDMVVMGGIEPNRPTIKK
jgi:hypothetical protein